MSASSRVAASPGLERGSQSRLLHSGFLRSAETFPNRPALEVDGRSFSYRDLRSRAAMLAATIARVGDGEDSTVALLAQRSVTAFAGILGVLMAGRAYVPLNPRFAPDRNRMMLQISSCRIVVVDSTAISLLEEVLGPIAQSLVLIFPDVAEAPTLSEALSHHQLIGAAELSPPEEYVAPQQDPASLAYLLFTSGSTGVPKGVMVTHGNVAPVVQFSVERYDITHADRLSQTHELTFDVSVWDMFVAWECGACLCCPSAKELLSPGRFIRESEISVWFSVPSTWVFMKQLGMLKAGSYPVLRWSLFAGEPLPVEVAEAWSVAAPNSRVENLYGPTELAIVCFVYSWTPHRSAGESESGIVPIGYPFPGMTPLVCDEQLREVAPGETGELLMSGPQVTLGYWANPEATARAFVSPPSREGIYYRTGDRVRRPINAETPCTYLGRIDQQIKVRGVRVELGEVEAALRQAARVDSVVAVAWPVSPMGAEGIEAFVAAEGLDLPAVRRELQRLLPPQMIPRKIHLVPQLPLNPHGKVDRAALLDRLEAST